MVIPVSATNARSGGAPVHMASGQLIGVRRAGAPFWGAFNLRSPTFEHLLDELATSRGEIARLRTELVEALYRLVPEQKDRNARRALLRLKRDVHNGRRKRSAS